MTTRDEMRVTVVDTLMSHKQMGTAPKCRCGWSSGYSLNDTESDRQQWAWHIADEALTAHHSRRPKPPTAESAPRVAATVDLVAALRASVEAAKARRAEASA